jgi:hypothetical protein
MRTTVDIDTPVLTGLKRLARTQHKSLGRLVSDLLAETLNARKTCASTERTFAWIDKPMGARVDVADRDAVHDAMDREPKP